MFEILDITVAKPERMQSVRDASEELQLSSKDSRMYERFFGLENFPRDPDQTLQELIEDAVVKLVESTGFTRDDLALVMYCHTVPSIAPLRDDVILPIDVFRTDRNEVFSVTMNHCATGVSALELIEAILPDDGLALLVMGDKGFHSVLREIKNTTIMGESAVAMLIGKGPGKFRHVGTHTERLGKYAVMSGLLGAVEEQGFAKEYVEFVARCVRRCLARHDMRMDQMKLVLPRNVNLPSWDQVAHGYLSAEHPNNVNFGVHRGQRSYRTGDLGRLGPDGEMTVIGRIDRQIKLNGLRIELGAIEQCALQVDGIAAAAVLPPFGAGNVLTLVLAGASLSDADKGAVRDNILAQLPAHMLPGRIVIAPDLPRNLSGKIDRKKLTAQLAGL